MPPPPDTATPPFAPGEIVMINGFAHLGLQRVAACTWGAPPGSAVECWMCECRDAVPGSFPAEPWRGPAAYLSRHSAGD